MIAVLWLCAATGGAAQASETGAKAQEAFAIAVATAHARGSLTAAGAAPFEIHATVLSDLALQGQGKGTYGYKWVDAQHWQRTVAIADFKQDEVRLDAGRPWVEQEGALMPLRVSELLQVVTLHVPSSTAVARVVVTESAEAGSQGEALDCFASAPVTPNDGFARRARWCFGKESGVLVSEDMPLNTHVLYSGFRSFQGKTVFTHVRVTSGTLQVLEAELSYASLSAQAMDGVTPGANMHRSESAGARPNPEEMQRGATEYRDYPPLPPQTPEAERKKPVLVQLQVSAEGAVVDACVEDAPTRAMAVAALQAARRSVYTPLLIDGKPVRNRFYSSVWFRAEGEDAQVVAARAGGTPDAQPKGGVYRNEALSFVFSYPGDFEQVPRGELEQENSGGNGHYGLEPGTACNTLLFRAQRRRAGKRMPEIVYSLDLAPMCIWGVLDDKALETIALDATHSVANKWVDSKVARPTLYKVGQRVFAVDSARGHALRGETEGIQFHCVLTRIHDHVVSWIVAGPDDADLSETMDALQLQLGEESSGIVRPFALGH